MVGVADSLIFLNNATQNVIERFPRVFVGKHFGKFFVFFDGLLCDGILFRFVGIIYLVDQVGNVVY